MARPNRSHPETRSKRHSIPFHALYLSIMLLGSMLALPSRVSAMPMFARAYNLPCARCHTMAPRLTNFGYAFYRAGYRLPKETEERTYEFQKMASFLSEIRLQNSNGDSTDSGLNVENAEVQMATSIKQHLAAKVQLTFSSQSEASSGFNEAWAQYNSAAKGAFWTVRGGQIPVLSGFKLGGDRSFTLTDALMFGANGPLTGADQGNFGIAGLERGIEAGYTNGGFTGRASWFNGINAAGAGDVALKGRQGKDYAFQAEYLIGKEGSAVSGYHYSGKQPLVDATDPNVPVPYNNAFTRDALFANWTRTLKPGEPGIPRLAFDLNAGELWGRDRITSAGAKARSRGDVVETDLYFKNRSALVARYDTAKPTNEAGAQTTTAFTFAIAHRPTNY